VDVCPGGDASRRLVDPGDDDCLRDALSPVRGLVSGRERPRGFTAEVIDRWGLRPPPGCSGVEVPCGPGLHRFGSALNHHVHLHACATDGVFIPTGDGPPALLRASRLPKHSCWLGQSTRPIWPRSPRRYAVVSCAGSACSGSSTPMRPPLTLERLSERRGEDGRIARVKSDPDTPRRTARSAARDRHPQPPTAFHATVRTAREKSGFKAGSSQREKSGLERG
jgi:hypothetical protein